VRLGVEAALVGGVRVAGDVEVEEGRVAGTGLQGRGRGLAVPGLVDLQVNGAGGVDLAAADGEAYERVADALLAEGVTAFQPTLVTAPEEMLVAALRAVPPDGRLLGIHLEGPFLSPERLGAHPAAARRDPDRALAERLLEAGPVTQVTLAPELPGALDLVDLLRDRGVVVSLGHSDATATEAARAFDRGASSVTHLFNAMRPFEHREPGLAGSALARADVHVQVIADGIHLADETLLLAWRAAAGRLALVSDGVGPTLAGVPVERRDGVPRRPDGTLAGGAATLLDGVRRLHRLGVPLVDAVAAATAVPARLLRRRDVGALRPGARADLLVLDDRLELRRVLLGGVERFA
jgi:N-acetylglucosamine-6-phosphate deacetylase